MPSSSLVSPQFVPTTLHAAPAIAVLIIPGGSSGSSRGERTRDDDGACKGAQRRRGSVVANRQDRSRGFCPRARILCRLGNCSWQLTYQHTDDSTYGSRRRGSSECLARPCGIAVAANATLEPVQEICCSPLLLRHRRRSCFVDISHQVARVMRVRLCRPKRSEHAQQHISHRNRRHPARQAKHAAQNKARSTSLRIASIWHLLAAYCMQSPDGRRCARDCGATRVCRPSRRWRPRNLHQANGGAKTPDTLSPRPGTRSEVAARPSLGRHGGSFVPSTPSRCGHPVDPPVRLAQARRWEGPLGRHRHASTEEQGSGIALAPVNYAGIKSHWVGEFFNHTSSSLVEPPESDVGGGTEGGAARAHCARRG